MNSVKKHPLIIFTKQKKQSSKKKQLEKLGVEVVELESNSNKRLDLNQILTKLARKGLSRILVEGGAEIYSSFLEANLVDEIMIYRSPKIIGLGGLPMFSKTHEVGKFKLIN